jgi:hypothetical protein
VSCCDEGCATLELDFAAGSGAPDGVLPDGDTGDFLQWNGLLWVPSNWTLPLATTNNDLGEVLTVDAAGSTVFQPLFQRTLPLAFGLRQLETSAVWMLPWQFDTVPVITATLAGFIFPIMSGRLRNMRVQHSTPVVSADNITYTLVVNELDAALVVAGVNTNTTSASNLIDVVEVGATDRLSVRVSGMTAQRVIRPCVSFTLEF